MKYLEYDQLVLLSDVLTNYHLPGITINGRIDAFTCKKVGDDKQLAKVIDSQLLLSLNNKGNSIRNTSSNGGTLSVNSNRKLFIDLIQTMNTTFPDYDFTNVHPDSFSQVREVDVMQQVNSLLGEITLKNPSFLLDLYQAINEVVCIHNCSIYSFSPLADSSDHPFDGALWSFNFFFFNKELKRVCYFTCMGSTDVNRTTTPFASVPVDDDEDDDDYSSRSGDYMDLDDDEEY